MRARKASGGVCKSLSKEWPVCGTTPSKGVRRPFGAGCSTADPTCRNRAYSPEAACRTRQNPKLSDPEAASHRVPHALSVAWFADAHRGKKLRAAARGGTHAPRPH